MELIRNKENHRAPYARNLAAARAVGDILAFIDSDCLAGQMWLRELVPAFKEPEIAAVGGMVEGYYRTLALDRYEHVRSSLNMGPWPKRSEDNDPFFYVPSCNFLVRRRVFSGIGGFNESLFVGEDVDLCWRIRERGFLIDYLPSGSVFHKHRNKVTAFCRRRFDYGTSEPMLNRLYPEKIKQMILAPWVSLFWTGFLLAVFFRSAGWLLFSSAIFFGESVFIFSQLKQRDIDIPLTMLVIALARGYASFVYHLCAFFSRYYLIWTILLFAVLPIPVAILGGMHLLVGAVEYGLKKPELDLVRFLIYFTIEQLSYQLGVWWQCLKQLSFNPVNPRVTWRMPREN